jgi:hypothetical protein
MSDRSPFAAIGDSGNAIVLQLRAQASSAPGNAYANEVSGIDLNAIRIPSNAAVLQQLNKALSEACDRPIRVEDQTAPAYIVLAVISREDDIFLGQVKVERHLLRTLEEHLLGKLPLHLLYNLKRDCLDPSEFVWKHFRHIIESVINPDPMPPVDGGRGWPRPTL